MRKLLNTIYITNELAFLSLDGENLVCKIENEVKFRIPFENVENIVCFSYLGCSPALMGKCVEKNISINFMTPSGKFLAKICGGTRGNVFLRVRQIEKFSRSGLLLAQNTVAAKIHNTIQLLRRSRHDNADLRNDENLAWTLEFLKKELDIVFETKTLDELLGIEGSCAKYYFEVFGRLFSNSSGGFVFEYRTKRPPLDPINATLSFVYTLLTNECASALETVGLDSYIGFYHTLRSGRESLACDLVEEFRATAERFVIGLINLRALGEKDFEQQISGAVLLNDDGRKKLLTKWQEKKREMIMHPIIKEKIPFGLFPYVQSNLLAKYVRDEFDEYPCYLQK